MHYFYRLAYQSLVYIYTMKVFFRLFIQGLAFVVLLYLPQVAKAHTEDSNTINNARLITVAASQAVVISGTLYALNEIWYKGYERSGFHVKDDMGVWCQVDKLGHAYSAYSLVAPLSKMYKWAGANSKRSALYGTVGSLAVLTAIEFMDAYSAEWGFSYGDMGANVLGAGLYLGQELLWEKQIFQLKFSTQFKNYSPALLKKRGEQIYGTNITERLLKDYNAQTYWLSVDVNYFYKRWPAWLNIAVGYGAEDMYGAYYNTWKDAEGKYHDMSSIHRYRQMLLSLDVNLANINTRSKFINTVLDCLTIKIPAPALEYNTKGKFVFHPLYF